MRARPFVGRSILVAGVAVMACAVAAMGQDDWRLEAGGALVTPYQPQLLPAGEQVVDLLETVRLTLANDPNLILRTEDWRFRLGVAQERAGEFDWLIKGDFSFDHREQELQQSVVREETQRRAELEVSMKNSCDEQQAASQKLEELLDLQVGNRDDVTEAEFNTELRILNSIIAALEAQGLDATDAIAAREAAIQAEIEATRTELQLATRFCDDSTADLERLGEVPEEEEFDVGRLNITASKKTRSGITFAPFLRGSYNSTQFLGKDNGFFEPFLDLDGRPEVSPSGIPLERLIDFGGKNQEDIYSFDLGFEVNVPLLRNRGRAAVAAPEDAARIDWEASELQLEHATSVSVLNSVLAYWSLLAAQQSVCVQESSVALESWVVEITERLVEAEEMPSAELARARAGQANARARLQGALGDLVTARVALARTVGLTVEGEANAPLAADSCAAERPAVGLCRAPIDAAAGIDRLDSLILPAEPCTPFPGVPSRDQVRRAADGLGRRAIDYRYDVAANRKLVESGLVLARAADINTKPRLDLALGVWTIGRGESSLSNAIDNWVLPSWKVGARYEKPRGNNAAEGRLVQQQAQLRQRQVRDADLERRVRLAVVRTGGTLVEAIDQLDYAARAARAFEQAVRAELIKLREGETTLVDVILTEQQRTDALLAEIRARSQVAALLARLRFESGTLVERVGEENRITRDNLIGLPAEGGGA